MAEVQRLSHPLLGSLKLVVFDVDGVMTDGRLRYEDHGGTAHHFHVRDGLALAHASTCAFRVAVISGRRCAQVARRLRELRVSHVHQGVRNKAHALQALCAELNTSPAHTAFVGDDVNDLPAMRACALPVCVSNAAADVLDYVRGQGWVLASAGGEGAAREVIEAVARAQNQWPPAFT